MSDARDDKPETSELSHEPSTGIAIGQTVTDDLVEDVDGDAQSTSIAGRTPWQLARARLRRDKPTMFMLIVAGITLVMAVVAPILDGLGVLDPQTFHKDLIDPAIGSLPKGPWGGTSWAHPLGVEPGTGRDVLSRIVVGVTFSLAIAFSATILTVVFGTVMGLIAGFLGGRTDFWISRLIDMILSFPQTLMLLALSGMFIDLLTGRGLPTNGAAAVYIIIVLSAFGWPTIARIIRGQVLSLREREFVESAKSLGAKNSRIYFKELLPNLWAPILVYSTLIMPTYVSAEAALSYLNVGVKPPTPTLGNILANSVNYVSSTPTYFFYPGIMIAVIVLSFNLLGDGLRDALDPKAGR